MKYTLHFAEDVQQSVTT